MTHDVIVIGSGPAGANAAAALVERGRRVLMLDVGDTDDRYAGGIPAGPFTEIRRNDPDQHRYFLGDDFEGVPTPGVRVGAQLTPPRMYVTKRSAASPTIESSTFSAAESFALGGLGNAWGAGVFEFDEHELADWPIRADELREHYDAVAARIGVAAAEDDLTPFIPRPAGALRPADIDSNAQQILDRYARQRDRLNRQGFHMGRVPLAVCTRRHDDRGPHGYGDMDFWSDADRSVYRPRFTVEQLVGSPSFTYAGRQLVLRFSESENGVEVAARHVDSGVVTNFTARCLVLAAGTLGTTRIVLRSLNAYDARVPLLCNPYTYAPVLNWPMLGDAPADRRHSLAQISAIFQPQPALGARGSVQVQFYSYRSLLTFRLLAEAPLAFPEALRAMRLLMPALGILGINHDDRPSARRYCELRRGHGDDRDSLHVHYELAPDEERRIDDAEREVLRLFRSLGVWSLKRVRPGHGSSIHYAGTLPMTRDGHALTTQSDGLLRGTRSVYVADGSVFPYLPAKGLTFTIMANANRVATILAARLSS